MLRAGGRPTTHHLMQVLSRLPITTALWEMARSATPLADTIRAALGRPPGWRLAPAIRALACWMAKLPTINGSIACTPAPRLAYSSRAQAITTAQLYEAGLLARTVGMRSRPSHSCTPWNRTTLWRHKPRPYIYITPHTHTPPTHTHGACLSTPPTHNWRGVVYRHVCPALARDLRTAEEHIFLPPIPARMDEMKCDMEHMVCGRHLNVNVQLQVRHPPAW